jgi:hypothetical protein
LLLQKDNARLLRVILYGKPILLHNNQGWMLRLGGRLPRELVLLAVLVRLLDNHARLLRGRLHPELLPLAVL